MKKLSLNVDHVATLRQARKENQPDTVAAALIAEIAGADGITTHLREDRRHIQDKDVEMISKLLKTNLNLEMGATEEMMKIAYSIKPKMVTLVPEKREEVTTEGGLDLLLQKDYLTQYIRNLHNSNIKVSLFIAPDIDMIKVAHKMNADIIELHTGNYANAVSEQDEYRELLKLIDGAKAAHKLGMGVHAGHGINYQNVIRLAQIDEIDEFAIGHSIISHAVFVGLERAVKEMIALINGRKI